MTADASRYLSHDAWSDLGDVGGCIESLPEDIHSLCAIVQGLLIHDHFGFLEDQDFPNRSNISRATQPLAERLAALGSIDPQPPSQRSVGTCRDFALMLCGLIRATGRPARVRCGYAPYFTAQTPGWFEDHWITEYWKTDPSAGWRRADAQMTPSLAKHLNTTHDVTDMPENAFIDANAAWRLVRAGQADPDCFGKLGEVSGLWFMTVNLVRDCLALKGKLASDWDGFRAALPDGCAFNQGVLETYDHLAKAEPQSMEIPPPFWANSTG